MAGEPLANGQREIYTLDVGQADAHAIITEDGTLNLIDADTTDVGDELDTILDGRTTPETETDNIPIETFAVTHLHYDHSDGVETLHDHGYEIQHVIEPDESRYAMRDPETGKPPKGVKKTVGDTYARGLKKHGIESITQVSEGDTLSPDWADQVLSPSSESGKLEFTSPETGRKNVLKPTGANANSLAFKTEGERSALFMGDVEDTGGLNGETWLMHQHDSEQSDVSLNADVLILSHHGSHNATSEEFLDRVDPEVVLISSGLNNKHTSENQHDAHPHDATLKRLHDQDIEVYWTPGHGRLRTDLDADTAHPEPTTDLGTTNAANLAALKYYCREQDVSPAQIEALTPDHLPEETPEWVADSAPMMVETTEEIVDEAITNAETVEDVRYTLDVTPDAHNQLRETVQADREEHVTTRDDVQRNREAYFNAKRNERAYRQLPLRTLFRTNLPNRWGGIDHPLDDVPSPDEIDGLRDASEVPRAVKKPVADEQRKRGKLVPKDIKAAETATDRAVDTTETSEALCRTLRNTDGAHKDFLYAIDTPDAHNDHRSDKGFSETLNQTNQRDRTKEHSRGKGLSMW